MLFIYCYFFIFILWIYCCLLSNQENLCMIHLYSNLLYEGYSIINQRFRIQNYFLPSLFLILLRKDSKSSLMISSVSVPIIIFALLLVYIMQNSSVFIKLIRIIEFSIHHGSYDYLSCLLNMVSLC